MIRGAGFRLFSGLIICVSFVGCQSGDWTDEGCFPDQPAPGERVVGWIVCSDMNIPGGEGGPGDLWIANHQVRAILRNPGSSLTRVGDMGGTLIDFATWEGRDQLHEVVPLIQGEWIDVEDVELTRSGVRVVGTSLAGSSATKTTVEWSLPSEGPRMDVTGADDLWIHGTGALELLDGRLVGAAVLYGHDGSSVEDLGGAIVAKGTTSLYVATPEEGYAFTGSVAVEGTAAGADELRLYRGDEIVGKIALEDEGFSTSVDATVDTIQAHATGHLPSQKAAPGQGLSLPIGPDGWVDIQPMWQGVTARPFSVHWDPEDPTHHEEIWLLPPDGGSVGTGPKPGLLTLSAGPHIMDVVVRVDVVNQETLALGVSFTPRFDRGDWVVAGLGRPSDVDATWRGSNVEAIQNAWIEALDYVITAPIGEVGTATGHLLDYPALPHQNGSRTQSTEGYTILSWPWSADSRRGAHGAVASVNPSPTELLAAAKGGPRTDRTAVVGQDWLALVGAPYDVDPWPDFVDLTAPDELHPPDTLWSDWFRWLDAGAAIPPASHLTWVQVPDGQFASSTDIERAMIQGKVCAGTGPLLILRVEGAGPGEVAPASAGWPDGYAALTGEGVADLDTVTLYVDGEAFDSWEVTQDHWDLETTLPQDWRWALLAGWREDGSAWATTGPVWTNPP